MRIGIDVREFKKGAYTGLRTILHGVLAHVDPAGGHELVFFGNQHTDLDAIPAAGKKILLPETNTIWWDQVQLPRALAREKVDVFFTPYIKTPLWRVCPYVNTIADVIPLVISRFSGLKALLDRAYFLVYAFVCGRRSSAVITLSEDAKARINKTFVIDRNKVVVAYPAIVTEAAVEKEKALELFEKFKLGEPYLLYVGNFKPHKNMKRLIEAYCLLPREERERYRLLLVGGSGKEIPELEAFACGKGVKDSIVLVSNIEHKHVGVFMKNARLFVFPSLMEGFGIPPVEAMASGIPVASSNAAPMPEVLGEGALYFDPLDPGDMSAVMLKLLADDGLRQKCSRLGLERAAIFDPHKMSRIVFETIDKAGRVGSGKALVLALGGIGNTILLYPLLAALKSQQGREIRIVAVEKSVKAFLNLVGFRDREVLLLERGIWGILKTLIGLRKERIKLGIASAYTNWKKAWLFFAAAGVKDKIACAPNSFGFLFKMAFNEPFAHEYQVNRAFARYLGLDVPLCPSVIISGGDEFAGNFFKGNSIEAGRPVVALHLGSGEKQARFRRWPIERFAALAGLLKKELNAQILVVGGAGEEELAAELISLGVECVSAAGKTDLRQLAALLKKCDIVIGNDSGIMHFAAALDVPVVAIFGPTEYRKTRPVAPNARIVRKEMRCSPCYARGRVKCDALECFMEITPEDVMKEVRDLLAPKGTR